MKLFKIVEKILMWLSLGLAVSMLFLQLFEGGPVIIIILCLLMSLALAFIILHRNDE
jgi:hypothetical protein